MGRPELTRRGRWMAAVLVCGEEAVLSHESAAALWGIEDRERVTTVSIPEARRSRQRNIRIHCQKLEPADRGALDDIPVTSPVRTLIDLATIATQSRLEAAVNAADKLNLVDPETLRAAVADRTGQRGVPALRRVLDAHTFRLTDSDLERRFLRLVRRAGLPTPETGVTIVGLKLDFLWRDLGLVVETDGLRYHRTAAQQARDRRRDQALVARGLTILRFTHGQVTREPASIQRTLAQVARRLARK